MTGKRDGPGSIVATPGGGLHVYFAGSSQPSGRMPRQHLDFRSRGAYVLVPPSQIDGRPYRLVSYRAALAGLDWSAVNRLLEPERQRHYDLPVVKPTDVSRLAGA